MGDPRAHSIFAPSASKRWMTCPGSIKLSEKCPPQKDTPASILGTNAHWVGEQCLKRRITANRLVGQKMPSGAKCTPEIAANVQRYVNYIYWHHRELGGSIYIEQRLEMPQIDPRMWGSSDVVQVTQNRSLHVFDLKYGMWAVEAEQNSQMMCYAIGAVAKFHKSIDLTRLVTAHICQPRPTHELGPFRKTTFSIDELIKFGKSAREAIKESDSDHPRFVDGDHCRFCPAEFICPKLNQLGRKLFI